MELLVTWLVLTLVVAYIADKRGHSFLGFFLVSLILSPLIGLIIALVIKPSAEAAERIAIVSGEGKKCPFCAEIIKRQATVCRFCGRDVSGGSLVGGAKIPPPPHAITVPLEDRERIYSISTEGLVKEPLSRMQIVDMWNGGQIGESAYYWKEGMEEWRPVIELV